MTEIRRTIKCSNCSSESSISLSSELELRELVILGKCRCGGSLQISYNLLDNSGSSSISSSSTTSTSDAMSIFSSPSSSYSDSSSSNQDTVNLDETLGPSDIPSDALRDLMED